MSVAFPRDLFSNSKLSRDYTKLLNLDKNKNFKHSEIEKDFKLLTGNINLFVYFQCFASK